VEPCLLGTTGFCGLSSGIGTSVTFDKAMVVTGLEWVLFSLGYRLLNNLHITTQAGRVGVRLGKLAVEPDGVVPWKLGEHAENVFVNLRSDGTGCSWAGHDPLLNAAGKIAEWIAMTFVDDTLESVALPAHVEITMVHRTSSVTVREDEWLASVLGLAEHAIETGSVVVHFVKDTGEVDRESRRAVTAVWSSAAIRDVGLMVRRVGILSVPAALEVELGTNSTRQGTGGRKLYLVLTPLKSKQRKETACCWKLPIGGGWELLPEIIRKLSGKMVVCPDWSG